MVGLVLLSSVRLCSIGADLTTLSDLVIDRYVSIASAVSSLRELSCAKYVIVKVDSSLADWKQELGFDPCSGLKIVKHRII